MKLSYKYSKLSATIALLILSFLIISIRPEQIDWAPSVYDQVPNIALAGSLLIIISCSVIYFYLLIYKDGSYSFIILLPVLSIITVHYLLDRLLGYIPFGDVSSHQSDIVKILRTGNIPDNVYPAFHILNSELVLLSGIEVMNSLLTISIFGLITYIITYILILSAVGIPKKYGYLIIIISSSLPMNPASFTYSVIFPLLILFWVTLRYTDANVKYSVLIFLLGCVAWIYHPLQNAILLFLFIITLLTIVILPIDKLGILTQVYDCDNKLTIFTASFAIIGFLWIAYLTLVFKRAVYTLAAILGARARPSTASVSAGQFDILLTEFGYSWLRIITGILIYRFLWFSTILLLGGISIIVCLRSEWPYKKLPFVVILGISIPTIFSFFDALFSISSSIQFARFARPALAFSIIGISYILYYVSETIHKRRLKITIFMILWCLVITSFIISLAGVYGHSSNHGVNSHITESDLEGYEWYFDKKDRDKSTLTLWIDIQRFVGIILTEEEQAQRHGEFPSGKTERYRPPDNFGGPDQLGEKVNNTYMTSSRIDRHLLFDVFEEWGTFTHKDYRLLYRDNTVLKVYSNDNVHIWYID